MLLRLLAALVFLALPALSRVLLPGFVADGGSVPRSFTMIGGNYRVQLKPGECRINAGSSAVAIRFPGSSAPSSEGASGAKFNNFQGSDTSKWRAAQPVYTGVRYQNVFPGADLIFHSSGRELEFDVQLAPGADPRKVRFEIEAGEQVRIETAGLRIGDVLLKTPVAYQETVEGKRAPISCPYHLSGHSISFNLGPYNENRPLIIDPVLAYSSFLGGEGDEAIRAVATDSSGNIYLAGATSSGNLPTSSTSFQPAFAGGNVNSIAPGDAFVAKMNGSTGALMWLTYLGGSANEFASGVAVDSGGNVYVTGMTNSSNFPVTSGALQGSFHGSGGNFLLQAGDAFVTKFDPTGSKLLYSTYLGGSKDDDGIAIAVDSAGYAYVTGSTLSTDFPATKGAFQTQFKGTGGQPTFGIEQQTQYISTGDAFVAKLNPAGTQLIYCTYLGGSYDDGVSSIAVDASGNAYVAGATLSSDFPTTAGAFQTKYGGFNANQVLGGTGDGFLAKLNPAGSGLVYSTLLGGSQDDAIVSMTIDGSGNAYVSGFTSSANFPATSGAYQKVFKGPSTLLSFSRDFIAGDAFAAKVNPQGSALIYATLLGGSDDDSANAIAIDSQGNAYIAGNTNSTDFPVTSGALQSSFGGAGGQQQPFGDAFVAKLDPTGSTLMYSSYLGGSQDDIGGGLAIDPSGNVWIGGYTLSSNFPLAGHSQQTVFGGQTSTADSFVAEISGLAPVSQIYPVISAGGVVGAGLSTPRVTALSQNAIVSVFGQSFAAPGTIGEATLLNGALSTNLGGTCVRVNGQNAPLFYVSPAQINFQAPTLPASGSVPVEVVTNCGASETASNSISIPVQTTTPEFFYYVINASGQNPIAGSDYTTKSLIGAAGTLPGVTTQPARPGDLVILYATGLGPTNLNLNPGELAATGGSVTGTLSVTVGGTQLSSEQIQYAGPAPGFAGLYQLNIVLPSSLGSGKQPVIVKVNGISSPSGAYIDVTQ